MICLPPKVVHELGCAVDHLDSVFLLVWDRNVLGADPIVDLIHDVSKRALPKLGAGFLEVEIGTTKW